MLKKIYKIMTSEDSAITASALEQQAAQNDLTISRVEQNDAASEAHDVSVGSGLVSNFKR